MQFYIRVRPIDGMATGGTWDRREADQRILDGREMVTLAIGKQIKQQRIICSKAVKPGVRASILGGRVEDMHFLITFRCMYMVLALCDVDFAVASQRMGVRSGLFRSGHRGCEYSA